MNTNLEQEFKTMITKEQYETLIKDFGLDNNIFEQKNYYFDTLNHDLFKAHTVLRIRRKNNSIKLTKKERGLNQNEALETHIFLNEQQADEMIKNGFDAQIIDLNMNVVNVCELVTYRAKVNYKDGTLFLDKNEYYGQVDYELEYEVDNIETGLKDYHKFLETYNIKGNELIRKSERAYKYAK